MAWTKGRHLLKFGFETRWVLLNQGTSESGTLTYTSPANFLDNSMGSASYAAILPLARQRKIQYFAYAVPGERGQRRRTAGLCAWCPADSARWIHAVRVGKPAAFSTPASVTFCDLGRNAFRAPAIAGGDLALAKNVSFGERLQLRFRADLFNVLNHAQYGAPDAVLGQSNFGMIITTISSYATGRGTPREFQLSAKVSF